MINRLWYAGANLHAPTTGKSKKAYRAEYDALMAEYKKTGSTEAKKAAKAISRFAF